MTLISGSPEETMDAGRRLAAHLQPGSVVAFTGGLGSGKTTFCRGLAQGLGVTDPVSSPSFAIAHLYRGPRPFAHFDAWRIESADDLEAAGFYDYVDSGAVVAVEWSENVAPWLGTALVRVDIKLLEDGRRQICIEGVEAL